MSITLTYSPQSKRDCGAARLRRLHAARIIRRPMPELVIFPTLFALGLLVARVIA